MMKRDRLILAPILIIGLLAMTLGSAQTTEETVTDQMAWVTPDGELVIHIERDGELLYFDSFRIAPLYDIANSDSLQWANRWEFRRE